MSIGTFVSSGDGWPPGVDAHVESYLSGLRAAGYAEKTLRDKWRAIAAFAEWMSRKQVSIVDADETHVAAFLRRSKRDQTVAKRALRGLLEHMRKDAGVAASSAFAGQTFEAVLAASYVDYLRNERGLAEQSVSIYLPFVKGYLAARVAATGDASHAPVDAEGVRQFLLDRVGDRPTESSRLCASALRSFLRFLFLRGETGMDFSVAIPAVRKGIQASVPVVLSPDEVERILLATDRMTPAGRRDHAILLLLARLGLRAGEVVRLELGDVHWRTGELIVRGKGQVTDRLPLPVDAGDALALYVQKDRGPSASRRVFLRMWAPRVGLTGPASVGHVVRQALASAGVRPSQRGAAHLFRHSLATRMIRHGASIPEIAEILRHRSTSTTEIYAKVAFETLRGVARPWPGTVGGR